MGAVSTCLRKYADFTGRARRPEYWLFFLFYVFVSHGAGVLDRLVGTVFIEAVVTLVFLVPSISVAARRLHDLGYSGWWQIVPLVPLVLAVALYMLSPAGNPLALIFLIAGTAMLFAMLVWFAFPGTRGPNAYGPEPDED